MRVRRELNRREFCGAATTLTAAGLATAGLHIPAWAASANEKEAAKSKSWPSFRNGNQLRGIASSDLPDKLELLWKVAVDDGVTATAAIVDGRVYAGTFGGELICFDRKNGKRIWTHFSAPRKKPNDFIPGFQSSPTVTKTWS